MALATTCPQCKTSFKVIPDQLKLRRGLVRCGVCQHVFSGIDYLRYVDDAGKLTARGGAEDREGAAPGRAPAVPVAPPASGSPVAPGSPGAPVARISPAVPGPRPIQPREQPPGPPPSAMSDDDLKTAFFLSDSAVGPISQPRPQDVRAPRSIVNDDANAGIATDPPTAPAPAPAARGRRGEPRRWAMRRNSSEPGGRGSDSADAHSMPHFDSDADPGFGPGDDDAAELSPATRIAPLDDDESTFVGRDALTGHDRSISDRPGARGRGAGHEIRGPRRHEDDTDGLDGASVGEGPPSRTRGRHEADIDELDTDTFNVEAANRLARDSRESYRTGFPASGLRRSDHSRRRNGRSAEIETLGDLVATPYRRYALIGLVALALIQFALCFRDEIASLMPVTRPILAVLGAPLGLSPGPVRSISALSIESFDIQASGQDDRLNLSAVIRNRSDRSVRWPAMELTLSDPSRAVVVRKVIIPATYLAQTDRRDGIGPRSEQPIRLTLEPRNVQLAGYTVALFYP